MVVEKVITDSPVVWQLILTVGSTVVQRQDYQVPPNTVISCEDSDLIKGTNTYLRPDSVFLITAYADGTPVPACMYLCAKTMIPVSPVLSVSNRQTQERTVSPASPNCNLLMVTPTTITIGETFTLNDKTKIWADKADIVTIQGPEGTSVFLQANTVFLIKQDPTSPQGPYAFTDHQIPLNMLEDDVEIPRT